MTPQQPTTDANGNTGEMSAIDHCEALDLAGEALEEINGWSGNPSRNMARKAALAAFIRRKFALAAATGSDVLAQSSCLATEEKDKEKPKKGYGYQITGDLMKIAKAHPETASTIEKAISHMSADWPPCPVERGEIGIVHAHLADLKTPQAAAAETKLTELERENRELREDKARLDWLEKNRQRLNAHCGSDYGWKVIQSHLVNRLMLEPSGVCSVASVDVNDCEVTKHDVRAAIDAARQALPARAQRGCDVSEPTKDALELALLKLEEIAQDISDNDLLGWPNGIRFAVEDVRAHTASLREELRAAREALNAVYVIRERIVKAIPEYRYEMDLVARAACKGGDAV